MDRKVMSPKLSPADQTILDELWDRKVSRNPWLPENLRKEENESYLDWMGAAIAELTEDVVMHVWNGTHPPDKNTTEHTVKKGTTVLIWMMSRFGDIGITDNLEAHCYHARVQPTVLVNWRFK